MVGVQIEKDAMQWRGKWDEKSIVDTLQPHPRRPQNLYGSNDRKLSDNNMATTVNGNADRQ